MFLATKDVSVSTKVCFFCRHKIKFVFCRDKIFLSQQTFCHDKHTFVATKDVFCLDKHVFVARKLLSRQNGYLWQLPPTIVNKCLEFGWRARPDEETDCASIIQVLPSLRSFCIYAAFGILALFFLQAIFFTSCLTLDLRRQVARRDACCCCFRRKESYRANACSQRELIPLFFKRVMEPVLALMPVKVRLPFNPFTAPA